MYLELLKLLIKVNLVDQTCDVTLILQSDWPANILADRSNIVWAVFQTLCVFILKELNMVEGTV